MLHDRMMNDRANGVGLTMRNVDFLINDVQLSRLPEWHHGVIDVL